MDTMDSDWRDRDDLDLTSEDITAMFDAGEPAEVRGPSSTTTYVPLGGKVVEAIRTFGGQVVSTTMPGLMPAPVKPTHR